MAPPDPYRNELRAAQNRIAMLEEKLVDRGPRDEDDPEIARMLAAQRVSKVSANPAVAAGRALTVGLFASMLAAIAVLSMTADSPHVNVARLAIVAIGVGAVVTGLLYRVLISLAQGGIESLDRDLAERRRRNGESRRQADIDRRLRAAEAASGGALSTVRIEAVQEVGTEEEEERDEKIRRERRTTR